MYVIQTGAVTWFPIAPPHHWGAMRCEYSHRCQGTVNIYLEHAFDVAILLVFCGEPSVDTAVFVHNPRLRLCAVRQCGAVDHG